MTSLFLVLFAFLVGSAILLTGAALALDRFIAPWLDRRATLRRMVGK